MRLPPIFLRLVNQSHGAIGAEFALVLPVLILFLFGIIDVGRYMWSINEVEKATQMGARMAVVTDMVPSDLAAENFGATLGQGAAIPTTTFGSLHCDKFSGTLQCSCDSNCSGIGMTADAAAFQLITDRMSQIAPILTDRNVRITYTNSGLGFAGDPNGPDVAPIVTVSTNAVGFAPLIFQFFGASAALPNESASLTLEDGQGTTSN
jgi:Flp pilus assembly protein TadG